MINSIVNNYLSSVKGLPFFYWVGDADYLSVLDDLRRDGLKLIRISDYCNKANDDKYPSIDELIDDFRTSDVDYKDNKFVVVGLGEYLAFKGKDIATSELIKLKNTTLGNSKVVILVHNLPSHLDVLLSDHRLLENQRICASNSLSCNISFFNHCSYKSNDTIIGMKNILHALEDGVNGKINISTTLFVGDSLFSISEISDSYSILKKEILNLNLNKSCGDDANWDRFLEDYLYCKNFYEVFNKYNVHDSIDEFYDKLNGYEYVNWLYFILLKNNEQSQNNQYLKYVLENTNNFLDFKNNILNLIILIDKNDNRYSLYYKERKKLIKDFDDSDISVFIQKNSIDIKNSIYYYTDNTLIEKKAILSWIATYGLIDEINSIYPALSNYLKKYTFNSGPLKEELTSYFNKYKYQKVLNKIDDDFMEFVYENAKDYKYAKLQTRDGVINSIIDKENTHLLWVDALGVEYLSYFLESAKQKRLSIQIDIARSELPTITVINKSFFDNWGGKSKYKEERLDNIKHKIEGGYYYTDDKTPTYLASELNIIDDVIKNAFMQLTLHKCKKVVIASDHGASRLAVIKNQEEKYDTDTKGEHSGRCCKVFDGFDLDCSVIENGFISLADYGRFKGSRKANVEVHGGASLEEIIVPIITLSLNNHSSVELVVLDENNIVLSKYNGFTIKLYISDVINDNNISIIIDGKKYYGVCIDSHHFSFEIDLKRAKNYTADVLDGDDIIGNITFNVKGKTGTINNDFDDLF